MNQELINIIKNNHPFSEKQIKTVLELLEDKNTVPFIARYRKELTGGLDEVEIKLIETEYNYAVNLQKRKEEVIRLIDEQGLLTEDLKNDILKQTKLQRIEDLYRPFKKKKKTRATEAKRKGLEPLATWIIKGEDTHTLEDEAAQYITEEVKSEKDAIKGAQDIIAEIVSDEPKYRKYILNQIETQGKLVTEKKKKAEDEKNIFEMYYEYEEPIKKIVPHRVLAINRGETEGVLKVSFDIDQEKLESYLIKQYIGEKHKHFEVIKEAIQDGLKRLILPSIEREIRTELTQKAENHLHTPDSDSRFGSILHWSRSGCHSLAGKLWSSERPESSRRQSVHLRQHPVQPKAADLHRQRSPAENDLAVKKTNVWPDKYPSSMLRPLKPDPHPESPGNCNFHHPQPLVQGLYGLLSPVPRLPPPCVSQLVRSAHSKRPAHLGVFHNTAAAAPSGSWFFRYRDHQ